MVAPYTIHGCVRPLRAILFLPALLLTGGSALAQTPLHTHAGAPQIGSLGVAVSAAGHVDADGVPDYAVAGATGSQGHVRIYSGATNELLLERIGSGATPNLGSAMAPAGDVNLDGHDDLVVGASTSSFTLGACVVLSGADGSELIHLQATEFGDRFGWAVGSIDVNADGRSDVIVGAPDHGNLDSGLVAIFSGLDGSLIRTHEGAADHFQMGKSVAGVGDLDGDGHGDVAVGSPGESGGGTLRLYSGLDGSLIDVVTGYVNSASDNLLLGEAVAAIGDIDLDGVPDFAAGSPFANKETGRVRVYSGADRSVLFDLFGSVQKQHFGGALGALGDHDGDGIPDFAVGGKNLAGPGLAQVFSGADGSLLRTYAGNAVADWFGRSLAGVGDTNGDAVPDLLVGSGMSSITTYAAGLAHLFSGVDSAPWTRYCAVLPNSTGMVAVTSYVGSPSLAEKDVGLVLTFAVPNSIALYIYSPQQQQIPFGNGNLCVGGGGAGIHRLGPFVTAVAGHGGVQLDFAQPPLNGGAGVLTPGSSWNFQAWYRDVPAGGAGFNLSDALSATFVP